VKSISFSLPRRKETKKKTALKRRAGRRRGEALELALPKRSKLALIQRSVPMPGQDLAQASVDATLIPEAAHKFAQRALREHQRAEKDVLKAVEHIVKSGQNLLKAYDLSVC
jgi:hypothetical protein